MYKSYTPNCGAQLLNYPSDLNIQPTEEPTEDIKWFHFV